MENREDIITEFKDVIKAIEHMFGLEEILKSNAKYDVVSTLYIDKDVYTVEHNISVNGQ